jgi:PAT family beta-lactamase induction signal transducer AmpG
VMIGVTWRSPEPEVPAIAPTSVREAVWLPFLGFLSRHRSLQILSFVLLYKLSDNLSQSLLRPFLIDMGYTPTDRGVALGTVGVFATILGTFLGGALTNSIGLGRGLWIFGLLQIFSNVGYILVAQAGVNRPLMYGAMTFEMVTTGLGMGAFGVLLLRLTQKRFSATQYALFSSLFALPRMLAGPVTGYTVYALGWTPFFLLTMVAGIPGLVMLARFVPWGERDPVFTVEEPQRGDAVTGAGLAVRGVAGGFVGLASSILVVWGLKILELAKDNPESGFDPAAALADLGRV